MVELAQNAADAAVRAGVAGRLLLRLAGGVLVAANTGAPLDAAGVEALATLRASSKRDASSTGRFGVGFAAVLTVSDEPAIGSRATGGVRWSRSSTRAEAAALAPSAGALGDELARRGSHVPVLRLPFPAEVDVPDGYDSAVVLPLRDAAAEAVVADQLASLGDWLVLALPGLAEVRVEVAGAPARVVGQVSARWVVVRRAVEVPGVLLGERPLEERQRTQRQVVWALPRSALGDPAQRPGLPDPDPSPELPGVVLAPTPTDEPLGLPALLVADLPLDPDRRHVAPGAVLELLARAAGAAYVDLLAEVAREAPDAVLRLLPAPVAEGLVDGLVREAAYAALPTARVLPTVGGSLVAPRDAVLLDDAPPEALPVLARLGVEALLPAAALPRAPLLAALGARRLDLADLLLAWTPAPAGAAGWQELYDVLVPAPREALGALPVPLADGRVVRGARSCVLAEAVPEPVVRALAHLGVRVVLPAAAHPLLERLGALRATPHALLELPELRAALEHPPEEEDEALALAEAVLTLVSSAEAGPGVGALPGLAGLLLPASDGELVPARDLVLPGSPLARLADPALVSVVDQAWRERWGNDVLAAVGVAGDLAVRTVHDVAVDNLVEPGDGDLEVDDLGGWFDDVLAACGRRDLPPFVPEARLVLDLDLVDQARWPEALALLAAGPARQAVVEPARVVLDDGAVREVASYAATWLRRHARIDGRKLTAYALPADPLLLALADPLPLQLDRVFAAAVGVRTDLATMARTADGVQDLTERLADPARVLSVRQLQAVYAVLASSPVVDSPVEHVAPPTSVRVVAPDGASTAVVPAASAAVLDAPYLLPLLDGVCLVPAAAGSADRLADLLDLPLASEEVRLRRPAAGTVAPVPAEVHLLVDGAPATWWQHDDLVVDGVELPWLVVDGEVHASTLAGLAYGVCWVADAWLLRDTVASVLAGELPLGEAVLLATL